MAREVKEESLSRDTLKIYWRVSKKYWFSQLVLMLLRPVYLASAYFANLYLVGIALDKLAQGSSINFVEDFGWIIIGLLIASGVMIVTEQLCLKLIWQFQVKVENDLIRLVYERLLSESVDFHANHFSGSLVSQTGKFHSAFTRLHDTMYWQVYALIINIIFTLIILTPRLPKFSLVLIGLLTLYFAASILANKKSKKLNTLRATAESNVTAQLADSMSNVLAIKSYSAENSEKERMEVRFREVSKKHDRLRRYTNFKDLLLNIPVSAMTILAVIVSVYAVSEGLTELSSVLLATALTRDLFMRVREFNINAQRNIARSFGDAHDMTKILLETQKLNDPEKPKKLIFKKGLIEFKDVDFKYESDGGEQLFNNLNLVIRPGEKVGLVGPSGGGKTTITKLLLRFMDVDAGEILLDGQNIAEIRQSTLRKVISYVPQEPLLFHRSISENIAYGRPGASYDEIVLASKLAHAQDFIQKLPKGYETLVGERGIKLSGGQKQRIAIARAILKNAPILVLDEATSSLDSQSEKLIQDALLTLMKNKTSLVIAHRLSTIAKLDRIIVLDEGQIVEEGTHRQLIAKRGIYANLWEHQSGGFLDS